MKPMLLTDAKEIPVGEEWVYETKYDGFRCILEIETEPILKSRNGKILNGLFPEIIRFCLEMFEQLRPFLPITFDGELVYLHNNFRSDFSIVALRGRMRKEEVIKQHVQSFPCHYIAFDLLKYKGESQTNNTLTNRQQQMNKLFGTLQLPLTINYEDVSRLQAIEVFRESDLLWHNIVVYNGEGIVAKNKTSNWIAAKRSVQWKKIKNWRYVDVILRKYDEHNNYFHGAVYEEDMLVDVVTFRHGLQLEELATLKSLFQTKGTKVSGNMWELVPSICVKIACIDFDGKSLREPKFYAFNLQMDATDCNWQQMYRQLFPFPKETQITHPEKIIWEKNSIQKEDYLLYLQRIFPHILPFLRDRLLTTIRFPHGAPGESFYQKNFPSSIPEFIATEQVDNTRFVLCNDLETLLWLGNQLTLEFHIPFQTFQTTYPTEIVFDLDPPSVKEFSLAVEAALRMKAIFDRFELPSFVKTSGGKGLQVYIPLPVNYFSYDDTRIFTQFVCHFLCEQEPRWFTTERMKKNRQNKLYLDYVQHHEGKTIIAPYSPRGNEYGLIATPLNWHEVNDSLTPHLFTIPTVLRRIQEIGNPFRDFRQKVEEQKFANVLVQLKQLIQPNE